MSGPADNLAKGWDLLRQGLNIGGQAYLGCQYRRRDQTPGGWPCHRGLQRHGAIHEFMKSCVQLYLDLAPGLKLDPVSTPFLDEDGRDAPSRSAAHKGPHKECPWCAHTFPPNPWQDLRAYEASKKSQRATPAAGEEALRATRAPRLPMLRIRGG